MNTLLLLLALSWSAAEPPPASVDAARLALPVLCAPPAIGTWWVLTDCTLVGDHVAPANVVVASGVTLTLAPGAGLDLDFTAHHLRIQAGARVIVGDGARIH